VQEIIARKILPRYKARRGKFHGAGREDLDVRMLGPGRPFVFEVVHPRNLVVDLEETARSINDYGRGRIEVTELVPVPRRRVSEIKETQSPKIYRALVAVAAPLSSDRLAELTACEVPVVQRTPQRVAHRRADKERARSVTIQSLLPVRGPGGENCVEIAVRCQHGTYVKEWISGEGGRSRPSLADLLGGGTRCLALDVWDVPGPFPPLPDRAAPRFAEEMAWSPAFSVTEDPWALAASPAVLATTEGTPPPPARPGSRAVALSPADPARPRA
jgi:tRNA pseudouridine synthase 10